MGLARHVVADFAEFRRLYGLEDELAVAEPGWADFLIDALASPHVAWLLLLIGGVIAHCTAAYRVIVCSGSPFLAAMVSVIFIAKGS